MHQFSKINGWDRFALETTGNNLIPVLHLKPRNGSMGYVIICNPKGKAAISTDLIDDLQKKGLGIVVADLSGTGEVSSANADAFDGTVSFHTIARAELWLGRTTLGEWVNELDLITKFLRSGTRHQK